MKQVWVNACACPATAALTPGLALPTFTTAMPEPMSMSELPSTSTSTPPPAAATNTGSVEPTPRATAAVRLAVSSAERGPGMSVTNRRSCGRSGPPRTAAAEGSAIAMRRGM